MHNADRILGNVRSDLIAMAGDQAAANNSDWRGALASNLRALGTLVERGELPDPYPVFRHGEASDEEILRTLRDAIRNALGLLDTPLGRRRHDGDEFYKEVVESLRTAIR